VKKTITKTVTVAALVLTALALCIACKNPGSSNGGGEGGGSYKIYTSAVNGVININSSGSAVEITAAPLSSDYRLVKGSMQVITQSGTVHVTIISETDTQGNYSFEMPAANVVVSASFRKSTDEGGPPLTKNQVFSGGRFNNAVLAGHSSHIPWYCDDEGRLEGTQAIRVGPDEFTPGGAGFSITMDAGHEINFSEVNALSFWARSPNAIRIRSVEFGTDTTNADTYSITYTGEDGNGITIDRDWTQYLIPIPSSKNVTIDGAFTLRINSREASRTLYIDDIEYITPTVSLAGVELQEPDIISSDAANVPVANILHGMKAAYTVGEKTVSLFYGNIDFAGYHTFNYTVTGAASLTGDTVTANTPGGTYNLNVTLGSVTKSETGQVSAVKFIVIEDCVPDGIGQIEGNSGVAGPDGYSATSWDASFETVDGKPCLQVLNRRWDGNRDWDREGTAGRTFSEPLDLSGYNKIIFTIRSFAPGLGYHFRVWRGGLAEENMYSTVVQPITNVWQEVEILLPDDFHRSERGDAGAVLGGKNNITRWEIATDYNNFSENYVYIRSIRASE